MNKDNLESVQIVKKMCQKMGYKSLKRTNGFIYISFLYLLLNTLEFTIIKLYFNYTNQKEFKFSISEQNVLNLKNAFMIGSIIIPCSYYILNLIYQNNKIWDKIFKEDYPTTLISSSEKRREKHFIKYPINTYSSTFLFNVGFYLIFRRKSIDNGVVAVWLGMLFNLLGIFSSLWWSTSKNIIRKLDNLFMEVHLLYLTLSYITIINPQYTNMINFYIIVYAIIRYKYIKNAKIVTLFFLEHIMSLYLCFHLKNVGNEIIYHLGNIIILMGFYYKIKDYLLKCNYGTGLFHIFAPISILLHYEWSLTL